MRPPREVWVAGLGWVVGILSLAAAAGASVELAGRPDTHRDEAVRRFVQGCLALPKRDAACETLRQEAVRVLRDDLLTLGSSADRAHLPVLAEVLAGGEPELRVAAAHAMGMIRPTPAETAALASALNDPVPDLRHAARLALEASSDPGARLLARRAHGQEGGGMVPEAAPDARRLGMPVYAGAAFLHFGSDLRAGRAAFVTGDPPAAVVRFYAGQARRAPMGPDQFGRAYSGALAADPAAGQRRLAELQARIERVVQEQTALIQKALQEGKSLEQVPELRRYEAEMKRLGEEMQRAAEGVLKQEIEPKMAQVTAAGYGDAELYGAPTFVVLEESTVGGLPRPARFVVVFEDRVLRRTGFVLHGPAAGPPPPAR